MDGIMALHSVDLVHCDIKLDNVFLTSDSRMAPFGICAKVADLDTCRDLKASRFGNSDRDWSQGDVPGIGTPPFPPHMFALCDPVVVDAKDRSATAT